MASTSKCSFCGSVVRSDEKTCPSCGAVNTNYTVDTPRTVFQPKTIEELKEYCAERGMPLLRMRFFVGEDFREPKAFGIYRDGKNVVVYKNKGDGTRAVRYKGPDEEHGVNELYQKLLDECHKRGIYPDGKPIAPPAATKNSPPIPAGLSLAGCETPKTISALQKLCSEKQIPLEALGFVIGNSARPNVTGITKSNGKVTIYRINSNRKKIFLCRNQNEEAAVARFYSLLSNAVDTQSPEKASSDGLPIFLKVLLFILGFFPVVFGLLVPTLWKWIPGNRDRGWPEKRLRSKKELPPDGRIGFFDRLAYNWNTFLFGEPDKKTVLTPREKQVDRYEFSGTGGYALRGLLLILVIVALAVSLRGYVHRDDGYYRPGDGYVYYNDAGDWYRCSDNGSHSWTETGSAPDDYREYYIGEDWTSDWGVTDVRDSSVWDSNHQSSGSGSGSGSSSSSDSPSSSSIDYEPWDMNDTDWDPEW